MIRNFRSVRWSIAGASLCFLAWTVGAGLAVLLVKFPTIAMLTFLACGLLVAPFLAMATDGLATVLEPTDVVSAVARFQSVALLAVVAFIAPLAATHYLLGVRLPPLPDPPGHPTFVFSAHGLDANYEIYLLRGSAKFVTRLTFDAALDWMPALSPDGSRVAFVSDRDGNEDIYVLRVDNPSSVQRLTFTPERDREPAWSPDGTRIAFDSQRSGNWDVWVMDANGGRPVDLTRGSANDEFSPAWSPDGTTLAFSSRRIGRAEIVTMPADGGPWKQLTGSPIWWATGQEWSQDGTRICFTGNLEGRDTSDIFTVRSDGTDMTPLTSDPGNEWGCQWFDHDRYVSLVSDRPELGFNFNYFVPETGGSITLYNRA
jgi:Tol biopolymer transport system component